VNLNSAFIQNNFNDASDLQYDQQESEVYQGSLSLSPQAFWTNSIDSLDTIPFYLFEDSRGNLLCGTFVMSSDGNTYKSTNGGVTWTNIIGTRANCMIEASDGNLYTGTGQGTTPGNGSVKKSYDQGNTWSNLIVGSIHGRSVMEDSSHAIYAGTVRKTVTYGSNKLYMSTDYGTNWTVIFQEGIWGSGSEVYFNWLYEMKNNNFLAAKLDYTGVFTTGIYLSSNKGTNWSLVSSTSNKNYASTIIKASDNNLYLCGTNGIIKTMDWGVTFQNVSDEYCNTLLEAYNGTFYKFYQTNVWKSYNRGVSWQEPVDLIWNGTNFGIYFSKALIQTADRRIYAGGSFDLSVPAPIFYTGNVLSSQVIWTVPPLYVTGYLSFSKVETLNNGQIQYEFSYSVDNGNSWSDWSSLTDALLQAVPCGGKGRDRLRIRITIMADSRTIAPQIDYLRLEYISGEPENLDQVVVAPNPVTFGKGEGQVTFFNLTPVVDMKVFSVGGGKVAQINNIQSSAGRYQWDLKNEKGEYIKSGVYICYLEDPQGNTKKLKLVVVQ